LIGRKEVVPRVRFPARPRPESAPVTYCLGILLPCGLVLASDSRSNAGIDQVTHVRKLGILVEESDRVITLQSAGNLATTQAVVTSLREALGSGQTDRDLMTAKTLFDATVIVGGVMRQIGDRDGKYVEPYGDPTASFLLGGEIKGEPPRLFQIYSAGNFVEASDRSPFLQIGETKYGKPILDRSLTAKSSLDEAARLALLSFDATIRSNLSVGLPIDLLRYRAGSFSTANLMTFEADDPYWTTLRDGYSEGLASLLASLPKPPDAQT
jgi:putative proteasome-type protease